MLLPSLPGAVLALSTVFAGAAALSTTQKFDVAKARANGAPPPPSTDPWYKAPAGYKDAKPGQVLKVRSAPSLAKAANISEAYNLLYRTTDSNYQPAWAVTTVYVPPKVSKAEALLSYQVAYDSANVDGSPSYTFNDGTIIDPGITQGLKTGWYVTVPDYEGPLASFTAGVQSGHATIDAVRATLNHERRLKASCRYAMWGYSGGALASEWAAELQVQYAPEMDFAGAALGGLTPNTTSVSLSVNKGPGAELFVNGILGLTSQDAAARSFIMSQLKTSGPYNATAFLAALHQNTTVDSIEYYDEDIFQYFKDGTGILNNPELQALTNRDGQMGYHGFPQMPIYAYKAIKDEISVVADTDALINRYCGIGRNIIYDRNTIGGHVAEAVNGGPAAFEFVYSVLEGGFNHTGCTIRTVTQGNDTSPA